MAEEQMAEEQAPEQREELKEWIPGPGDIAIRQVHWAWVVTSTPWIIVAFLFLMQGWLEEIMAGVLIVIVVLPRFFMWRRTLYGITDKHLMYQRGGLLSSKAYPLPYSRMTDVRSRYGIFGRALGYQGVDVMMDNGAVATLSYVPIVADTEGRIRAKIEEHGGFIATDAAADASADEAPDEGDPPQLDQPKDEGKEK